MSVNIEAAETLLSKHAPDVLEDLRGPSDTDVVALGAGRTEIREWRRVARLMAAALRQAISSCDTAIELDRRTLARAARWQLASDILGVIAPASIFVALKSQWPQAADYLSGGFALLAVIIALIARYLGTSPIRTGSTLDHYQELADSRGRALAILRQIDLDLVRERLGPEQEDLLIQGNDVCRRVDAATR